MEELKLKKFLSLLLLFILLLQLPVYAKQFNDVSQSNPYYKAIDFLSDIEIISGYDNGYFGIQSTITRSEMATLFTISKISPYHPILNSTVSNPFTDISNHWAYNYIINLYTDGIIEPDINKQFKPNDRITFSEVVQWAINACGLKQSAESLGGFPQGYISVAKQKKLLYNLQEKSANDYVNRGETAQLIYNLIKLGYQSADELNLYHNENIIDVDKPIYLLNDNVLIHIRTLMEQLNVSVEFDENTTSLQLSNGITAIYLKLNDINYSVNGVSKKLSYPPQFIKEQIYIPLKEITETLGYKFYLNSKEGNIFIYDSQNSPSIYPQIVMYQDKYIKNPDTNSDIYAKINYNGHFLKNIILENHTLIENSEYEVIGNYIVLKKEYIRSIANGTVKFVFQFENNIVEYANLSVIKQVYNPQKSIYKLFVDNKEIETNTGLYVDGNVFYTPIRTIAEICKLSVDWHSDTSTVTFYNDDKTIDMSLNSYVYIVNGYTKPLETPLLITNDITMCPIKVLVDEFGLEYKRDVLNEKICLFTMDFIESVENNNVFEDFIDNETVNITVNSNREENISIIIAYYNDTDNLISTKITPLSVVAGTQIYNVFLPKLSDSNEISEVRLMLWRNIDTMRPINEVITVQRENREIL